MFCDCDCSRSCRFTGPCTKFGRSEFETCGAGTRGYPPKVAGANDAQIIKAVAAIIPHVRSPCFFGIAGSRVEQERRRVGTGARRTAKKSLWPSVHSSGREVPIENLSHDAVALARRLLEARPVRDRDALASAADQSGILQPACDHRHGRPSHAQHLRDEMTRIRGQ